MNRRKLNWLGLTALAGFAATGAAYTAYAADMALARERLASNSRLFEGRFGAMEYAVAGSGPPCLMVHGTGGGFDQGLAFARQLIQAGWTVIAPSRFGYLRTAWPEDASLENQADALADLLDELNIARLPVIGGSAGALSALQFAIRHPSRCSALVALVPATYVPGRPAPQPGMLGQAIMDYALQSDFLFWAGMKVAENKMIATLLATDPAIVYRASAAEQDRVRSILHEILPVSARSKGLLNDAKQAGSPQPMPIEWITAPTLAISLEDDRFGTAAAARHIASAVPGANLIIYPSGGHVWVGHDQEVFMAIDAFLKAA